MPTLFPIDAFVVVFFFVLLNALFAYAGVCMQHSLVGFFSYFIHFFRFFFRCVEIEKINEFFFLSDRIAENAFFWMKVDVVSWRTY